MGGFAEIAFWRWDGDPLNEGVVPVPDHFEETLVNQEVEEGRDAASLADSVSDGEGGSNVTVDFERGGNVCEQGPN